MKALFVRNFYKNSDAMIVLYITTIFSVLFFAEFAHALESDYKSSLDRYLLEDTEIIQEYQLTNHGKAIEFSYTNDITGAILEYDNKKSLYQDLTNYLLTANSEISYGTISSESSCATFARYVGTGGGAAKIANRLVCTKYQYITSMTTFSKSDLQVPMTQILNSLEPNPQTSLSRYLPDVEDLAIRVDLKMDKRYTAKYHEDEIDFSYEIGTTNIDGTITKYATNNDAVNSLEGLALGIDSQITKGMYSNANCITSNEIAQKALACQKDTYYVKLVSDESKTDLESTMRQIMQKIDGKTPAKEQNTVPLKPELSKDGGCLIATATYGTELAPQVQMLRETRNSVILSTDSGTAFMAGFNEFYYTFSPAVADLERQSPIFKELVKVTITPILSTLSILNYADINSEYEMLGYGTGIILLNIGIYFAIPTIFIIRLKSYLKSNIIHSRTVQNRNLSLSKQ